MIDTHAHLNFKAFNHDCAQVIERSFANGVKAIINVGSCLEDSKKAIELAEAPPSFFSKKSWAGLYAAIGLHPIYTNDENFDLEVYKKLAQNKKVVAIGETGLDYFHIKDPQAIELQKEIFIKHIRLARELNLPLILHCRGSKEEPYKPYNEMLEILNQEKATKGVIHCFSANLEIAEKFLEMRFYIGFTGIITFTKDFDEVIKQTPIEKILTETDCPFLAPGPYRGKRCEPWHVKFILEKIVQIKNLSFSKAESQTEKNTAKLFKF